MPLGSSPVCFRKTDVASSYVNIFKGHLHGISENSIFRLRLVKLLLYMDKSGNDGKMQFSKIASFGRLGLGCPAPNMFPSLKKAAWDYGSLTA